MRMISFLSHCKPGNCITGPFCRYRYTLTVFPNYKVLILTSLKVSPISTERNSKQHLCQTHYCQKCNTSHSSSSEAQFSNDPGCTLGTCKVKKVNGTKLRVRSFEKIENYLHDAAFYIIHNQNN